MSSAQNAIQRDFINPTATPHTDASAWPSLRTDLQFHRNLERDACAYWMIYDPLRGQYLELGELELLILHHWHLGSAEKIVAAIARKQGCAVTLEQVQAVVSFMDDNELLQNDSEKIAQKLAAISPQQQRLDKLQRSIFWRHPLFAPDLSSRLLLPLARCSAQKWFYVVLLSAAIFSGISIGQHWPEFLAYFDAGWNAAGAAIFFLCYLCLSLFHELGHASVARYHGVRANSIGVGLIALMPIMFSEITDAWRLPRRARLHISAAGVTFEATLGVAAALGWCLLEDGPVRALMFYLFTTSLVSTLLINANPLMKFDGYYLLSDFAREKNLQQSATTALRQWCWLRLLRDRPAATDRRQKLLVFFGAASLLYRIVVFALISYAAYQLLFKAAGVLILVLCIGLLLAIPAVRETRAFFSFLRKQKDLQTTMKNTSDSEENRNQKRSGPIQRSIETLRLFNPYVLFSLGLFAALLLTPLPWPVQLPASTYFARQQNVMAPAGAELETLYLQVGHSVRAGDMIAELHDSELDYRLARTREELQLLNRRQHSDGFAENLDALDGVYLQDLLSKRQLLHALQTEQQQLQIAAKVSGTVDWTLPGLTAGQYLDTNQLFLTIADRSSLQGRAYGMAQQVARFGPSQQNARLFIRGHWKPFSVTLRDVDPIASHRIQDPALASDTGGPLQTQPDDRERSASALHLVTFEFDSDAAHTALSSAQRTGYLVVFGEPVSLMELMTNRVAGVLIRESGV